METNPANRSATSAGISAHDWKIPDPAVHTVQIQSSHSAECTALQEAILKLRPLTFGVYAASTAASRTRMIVWRLVSNFLATADTLSPPFRAARAAAAFFSSRTFGRPSFSPAALARVSEDHRACSSSEGYQEPEDITIPAFPDFALARLIVARLSQAVVSLR